jgi:hypothetical protein
VKRLAVLGALCLLSLTLVSHLGSGKRALAADDPDRVAPRQPYLDEMLRARWAAAKVKPSPIASDPEFLRRAYLDFLGRVPNLAETESFLLARDSNKRAKLIERLLEHPDFAKNLANEWLIALVGRRPQGNRVDTSALATWLRRQFAENKSWRETADALISARGSNQENGAVNFSMAHMQDDAVNLTSITTRVFLGQQIQCTQCHDHPANDWKQDDFWGINAFFKGMRTREVSKSTATGSEVYDYTELYDEPSDAYSTFERRNAAIGISFPTYLDGRKISQGTDVDRRRELANFIASPENEQFARAFVNRTWAHFMGRGFVHPVDDFGPHNPPTYPELLDRLANDFRSSGYDVKALVRWIANSEAYQLSSLVTKDNEKDETLYSRRWPRAMTPEQLFDSLITTTAAHRAAGGNSDAKRREWLAQFVVAFGNDEETETTSFQGTIPQALMMMNGELMERATDGSPGSFLAETLARSQLQRSPAEYIVHRLYLAALSRPPTSLELRRAAAYFNSFPDPKGVIEDLFWSLLNSSEFVLNH